MSIKKLKALSIKQPWAWCILYAGKDIENRTRHTSVRGVVAIHASKTIDWNAYHSLSAMGYKLPRYEDLPLGQIVGTVEIVDSVIEHKSSWKQKDTVGYVLKSPMSLDEGLECRGQLGFWNVPDNIEQIINSKIGEGNG